VPGHALDILSSPLQRLLQVAREKSNRARKFTSKLEVDQTQREVELVTTHSPSSDPLLQEPGPAMNALDSDVLDEAFMGTPSDSLLFKPNHELQIVLHINH
jgi:hypothetical protein